MSSSGLHSEEYKLVVVVRQDIKMSKGKTAAHVGHAVISCAFQASKKNPKEFLEWRTNVEKIVALKIPDEKAVYELKEEALAQGLIVGTVIDAGRTEVEPGTLTCMGIGPAKESEIDKLTGNLPML